MLAAAVSLPTHGALGFKLTVCWPRSETSGVQASALLHWFGFWMKDLASSSCMRHCNAALFEAGATAQTQGFGDLGSP